MPRCACRGQIRFLRKGQQRCTVKLTISYEVPNAMAPFANVSDRCLAGWKACMCLPAHAGRPLAA